MDFTNRTPDRPTAMKDDAETASLWDAVRAGKRDEEYLLGVGCNTRLLAGRFDSGYRVLAPPLSPELQSLVLRTTVLEQDWEKYQDYDLWRLQDAAWRFAGHAFDLHPGDRVICDLGKTQRLMLTEVLVVGDDVGDLAVGGPILKKDGSPGKRRFSIALLRTPWRKLPAPP